MSTADVPTSTFSFISRVNRHDNRSKNIRHEFESMITNRSDFCEGYQIKRDEYPSQLEMQEFLHNCLDVNDIGLNTLNQFEEQSLLVYVSGFSNAVDFGIEFGKRWKTPKDILNIRNDQKLLLIVESCNGHKWVKFASNLPNICAIGSAWTSGIQLSNDEFCKYSAAGSIFQWALDRALDKQKKSGGSWIDHFNTIYDTNIRWMGKFGTAEVTEEEWKEVTKLCYNDNLSEWEDDFPKFYDKTMQVSPQCVVPSEEGMFSRDLLKILGVTTWEDVVMWKDIPLLSKETKLMVQTITSYLMKKLPHVPMYFLEVAALYIIHHNIRIEDRLPRHV